MSVWFHLDTAGRRIGYARVSTREQHLRMQEDALTAVGCDLVFTDHGVSWAQASRPGLDEALAVLVPGDAIIVYKLDRLGRSVLHLADLLTRRDLIRENTVNGLDAARRRGRRLGRPPSLTKKEVLEAYLLVSEQGVPISEMASRLDVSHSTLTRALKRFGLEL